MPQRHSGNANRIRLPLTTRRSKRPMLRPIEINSIGPINRVSIAVPEKGGVVVLKGRNGVGKTHALKAVNSVVTKNADIHTSDGAASGSVSAFGATLRVG